MQFTEIVLTVILLQDTSDNERTGMCDGITSSSRIKYNKIFTNILQTWDYRQVSFFIFQSNTTDTNFMNTLYFVLPRVTLKELPVWWSDLLRREVHFYTSSFIDPESLASIWIFYVRDARAELMPRGTSIILNTIRNAKKRIEELIHGLFNGTPSSS
jgi:hypothetical protein